MQILPGPRSLFGALSALLACGDAGSSPSDTTSSAQTTHDPSLDTGLPTTSAASPTTSATSGSATDADSATTDDPPPPPTFCANLDVSLVLDPAAPVFDPDARAALHDLFADLVAQTGARVRVLPNAGTELMVQTDCLTPLGNAPGDPILVYGEAGVVDPDAQAALDCSLDALESYTSDLDDGTWLFSGVLFPVLERDDLPTPGATGFAVVAAREDEALNNFYSQPGMAAESYLRLVGDNDRRRVAALTYGDVAGRLEVWGLALSQHSRHYERAVTTFAEALADWVPTAVQACDDFDYEPPFDPEPPIGCERVDVLFAIDGSLSMLQEQDALRGADGMPPVFADFTDALLAELTDVEDFHVGVVSAEPGDTVMHTHRDFPETPEGPDTDCGFAPGERWLVGPSPTFAEQFACVAATDSVSTLEVTAYNLAEALHDPANAGFLRDDSLLFAVLLTDEDTDDGDLARMVEIRQRVLDAVDGDMSRIVVLSVAGGMGTFESPTSTCMGVYGTASPARRLHSITLSFRERGLFQNICTGDLAATFTDVLDDVVSACEAYEPVG